MSKLARILIGLLSLAIFAGAIYAFADLQSNERVTLTAIRAACSAAGVPSGAVQLEVAGREASESLVKDAGAAGLKLLPLSAEAEGAQLRLVVGAVQSTGMFSSRVLIRRLGVGTDPGVETDYRLSWQLGWRVERTEVLPPERR